MYKDFYVGDRLEIPFLVCYVGHKKINYTKKALDGRIVSHLNHGNLYTSWVNTEWLVFINLPTITNIAVHYAGLKD